MDPEAALKYGIVDHIAKPAHLNPQREEHKPLNARNHDKKTS